MAATPNPADFAFELPTELIAQQPLAQRDASRLLCVGSGRDLQELPFAQVASLLGEDDLLVLNDTRVIPGRLFGQKDTGGKVEMLLERLLDDRRALVQLKSSRSPATGSRLQFEGGAGAEVEGREGTFFVLRFDTNPEAMLEQHGHMPLPPYISRADNEADRNRYQTVFAENIGAVAAPTAGLHFSEELLRTVEESGVNIARVTLHVGAGTFLPLREEQLESGRLHRERVVVDQSVVDAIRQTRERGGRVIAVGTTVVRSLESAARNGELQPFEGETDLFIWPGYEFQVVDAMITNFHLPESSLLMLVCAFHGTEEVLAAYKYAVEHKFRFFSYGDAMFLEKRFLEKNGENEL